MNLCEFLTEYFREEEIAEICNRFEVAPAKGRVESIAAIIDHFDSGLDYSAMEDAIKVIFDCTFELDEAALRKACEQAGLDGRGSRKMLLNKVMAHIEWPSSIEHHLEKDPGIPTQHGTIAR